MRNNEIRETTMVEGALRSITALLPASWNVDRRAVARAEGEVDTMVDLVAPGGARPVAFAAQVRRSGSVPTALLLSSLREQERQTGSRVLFVSDYVGPALRSALADEGMSYADATGWVRLVSEEPLVLLTGQGVERVQKRSRNSAIARLNGVAAGRIIRVLVTEGVPVGVRKLAEAADVSPGSVSKLLVTLAAEGIIDRDARGAVIVVRPRALIRRWIQDYGFTTGNKHVGYYIAPRGIDRTLSRLSGIESAIALTGSAAARRLLPPGASSIVPLRLLALYASAPDDLVRELGLIDADPSSANVVLARPQDPRVLLPAGEELPLAPPALVLADLLTLPNRSDAEAEQLMDYFERVDAAWKA